MEFALAEEQVALQNELRRFLAKYADETAVRAQLEDPSGYDRELWKRMGAELMIQGIAIPEEYGGSGFTFVEIGLVLEEFGRALTVSPFFGSCVMAAGLIGAIGDDGVKAELLPGIANGDSVVSVALAEDSGSWLLDDVTLAATAAGPDWTLDGHKAYVVDGAYADMLIVAARTTEGPALFLVASDAAGLARTPMPTMDLTRKLARIELSSTPARLIATGSTAAAAVTAMADLSAIGLAAECLGGNAKVLDMSVEYAKVREQFGRAIGSFQAIKHKCAAMLVELESSRSAVYYALWAAATGHEDLPLVAPLVKAHCVDTYLAAAGENIQIHGGIGFTWEDPAHLYLKRAKSSQTLLGDSDLHRQLLADRIGI
ncbi:acyl-CoA dehydrogenase family protein [Gordonia polyisoprenivorans]|uniref:acyl-CoA dehydrogenase family protein n=1 Tax=Gordonia polyisoprenivorans TaxID=84595 RepID=UPI001AD7647B|nr:acyl-CoA dehydrogenase family protein [Gordonia polyisoprenivorans]QTI70940.1 acyl-CoA/acyl-ACP dehydrogenase [Gordonia polyisoprenivorans]